MAEWKIVCDDILSWCKTSDYMAHAILCDPPYHLTGGFMSKDWDKDGPDAISFQKETWAALAEHLLPGGFLFVFASSRGWHRLACALEDTGLIIQPSIFNWRTGKVMEIPFCLLHLTGQSFPKSTRIISRASDSSPFCQCDDSPRQSLEHDSQYNDHDGKSKGEGSQSDCFQGSHLGDALPRQAQVDGPDVLPLQGDAQEHNHSDGPLLDVQGDNAPSHIPCRVQHNDQAPIDTFRDLQELSDDASQSLQVSEDETYHECDSQQPNTPLNKTVEDSALACKADDKLAYHKLNTHSLDNALPSGSLDTPFIESFAHDTTNGPYCQICGKVKQDIWEGHRYGGQVLKDAATPIIVAQKPWEGKRLNCIVETGAGSLWVDGARITCEVGDRTDRIGGTAQKWGTNTYAQDEYSINVKGSNSPAHPQGRWPANFCLIHSPKCRRVGVKRVKGSHDTTGTWGTTSAFGGNRTREVREPGYAHPGGLETVDAWDCSPECPARKLGEQSGQQKSGKHGKTSGGFNPTGKTLYGKGNPDCDVSGGYDDKGTATRYFFQADWEYECAEGCPVARLDEQAGETSQGHWTHKREIGGKGIYGAGGFQNLDEGRKIIDSGGPSRFYHNADWSHEVAERLAGADPVRYCPKAAKRERNQNLDDFYWQIDKTAPIGFVRIDKDEWEALGREEERIKEETGKRVSLRAKGNIHSTVKPISLLVWLCRLLAPPEEYAPRRLLIPFSGSGSEICAAIISGCWEEVVGIEISEEYCSIAEARAEFWHTKSQETGSADPRVILKKGKKSTKKNDAQMPLDLDSD